MRKIFLLLFVFCLAACSTTQTPLFHTEDLHSVDFSQVENFKRGSSCSYSLFAFIGPFGDISLFEAVQDAQISTVITSDRHYKNYLLFSKDCIRVYGY